MLLGILECSLLKAIHTGEKKFQCQYCGQRFTYAHGLKSHIERMHEIGMSPAEKSAALKPVREKAYG